MSKDQGEFDFSVHDPFKAYTELLDTYTYWQVYLNISYSKTKQKWCCYGMCNSNKRYPE